MTTKFDKLNENRVEALNNIIDAIELDDYKKKLIKINWVDFIKLMECLTKKHYIRYNILNIITIVSGILIPVIINISDEYYDDYVKITATILGLLVSICTSINQSYKINERWQHFRKVSEELKIEGDRYLSLSEKYKNYENYNGGAFKLFMTNIENIKSSQISFYIEKIAQNNQAKTEHQDTTEIATAASIQMQVAKVEQS